MNFVVFCDVTCRKYILIEPISYPMNLEFKVLQEMKHRCLSFIVNGKISNHFMREAFWLVIESTVGKEFVRS